MELWMVTQYLDQRLCKFFGMVTDHGLRAPAINNFGGIPDQFCLYNPRTTEIIPFRVVEYLHIGRSCHLLRLIGKLRDVLC